jgi:hypothetical protein
MNDRYSKAGKSWTAEDEHTLRQLFASSQTLNNMCGVLQRSSAGILARLLKLELIDRITADRLQTLNWSCIPAQIQLSLQANKTSAAGLDLPAALAGPIQYNSVSNERLDFEGLLDYLKRLGDHGCKPDAAEFVGRYFDFDGYSSFANVCYQLRQVQQQRKDLSVHRFVFSFGTSSIDAHKFLKVVWQKYWKKKPARPFHWYGLHHQYPGNFHVHAIVEGWNWDFQPTCFDRNDLVLLESLATEVIAAQKL